MATRSGRVEVALLDAAAAPSGRCSACVAGCRSWRCTRVGLDEHTPDLVSGHERHSPGGEVFGDIRVLTEPGLASRRPGRARRSTSPATTTSRCGTPPASRSRPGPRTARSRRWRPPASCSPSACSGTRRCGPSWTCCAGWSPPRASTTSCRLAPCLASAARRHRPPPHGPLPEGGTVRPITRWGDPRSCTGPRPVTAFDEELRTLVADMVATMYAADGVGLAACQIGVDRAGVRLRLPRRQRRPDRRRGVQPAADRARGPRSSARRRRRGLSVLPGAFVACARPDWASVDGAGLDGGPGELREGPAGPLPAARDRPLPPARSSGTGCRRRCARSCRRRTRRPWRTSPDGPARTRSSGCGLRLRVLVGVDAGLRCGRNRSGWPLGATSGSEPGTCGVVVMSRTYPPRGAAGVGQRRAAT